MKKTMLYLLIMMFFSCSQAQVIAEVNDKKLSLNYLKQELKKLPENVSKNYANDCPGFLEELITKEVLLQEAKRLKIDTIAGVKERIKPDKNNKDNILIEMLLKTEVMPKVQVSEEEMQKFYKDNIGQMQGLSYEQMKPQIQSFFLQQKQQDAVGLYVDNLCNSAKISRNEKWLKQEESKIKNPINEALKNKLPSMVDFGAGTCMPCIQMKPIIEELQKELKNKANILLIDVNEQQVLTRKYKIMLIPTQIFFDATGVEIYRHVGFFPKDSILVNLKNAGLN
ncbi:MAG TPA: thioredoxin family protein [bacterium]